MTTLHIDNTVHDFASWKEAFDRYEQFREQQGVRSYRVSRDAADPQRVLIDLEFDDLETATRFRGALEKIWATPMSRAELIDHGRPLVLDVVARRTF